MIASPEMTANSTTPQLPEVLTPREAAEFLRISTRTLTAQGCFRGIAGPLPLWPQAGSIQPHGIAGIHGRGLVVLDTATSSR